MRQSYRSRPAPATSMSIKLEHVRRYRYNSCKCTIYVTTAIHDTNYCLRLPVHCIKLSKIYYNN